jgi:polyhydroxyalkanoate synthesis regulator phasin
MAREAIRTYNATRHTLPKCEAVRRTDGGLCQQIAMGNGRCYLHGGRTPKGKDWHRPQPGADAVTTQRKLKDMERAAKKRAKRLAAMTPEERERHEEWQKAHKPGPAGPRAAARARRAQSRDVRERLAKLDEPAPQSAEVQALAGAIEALRHQAQQLKTDQDLSTTNLTGGIFG